MLKLHLNLTWNRFLFILFSFLFCESRLTFSISLLLFSVYLSPSFVSHFLLFYFISFFQFCLLFVLFCFLFYSNGKNSLCFCCFFFILKIHWFVLINLFIYTQRDANHPDGTSKVSFTIPSHIPFAN